MTKHTTSLLLASLCFAAPVHALGAPPPLANPQEGEAAQQTVNPGERYEQLVDEVDTAYEAWVTEVRAKYKKAQAEGKELSEEEMTPPFGPFLTRFLAAASEYAGTDDAVPFLLWVVERGGQLDVEKAKSALTTLLDSHMASEELAPLGPMLASLTFLLGEEEAAAACKKIESDSGSPSLRAWATYSRVASVLSDAAIDSEEYKSARKSILARLELSKDEDLASTVRNAMREREAFAIGMVAPDIEGIDLDGTAFKLSDYKGKIIFLDFWGDW